MIGAMTYGTYEFTSMAIMKNWSWWMVATDTTWGAVLTVFSAWAGVTLVMRLQGGGAGAPGGRLFRASYPLAAGPRPV
jgi:uncharacterized membrane protein